jgi:tubulin epsilon
MALKEHAAMSKDTTYDEPLSSFFRNVDARHSREDGGGLPVGSSISQLKARAVLVDTEDGVLKQLLSGSLGEIFDGKQIISDEVDLQCQSMTPA